MNTAKVVKVMITLRLDPEQYNEVVKAARLREMSLNEHCLRQLGVSNVKHDSKPRGRAPKLRNVANGVV